MLEKFPDSVKEIDQYIVRFVNGAFLEERCIRLKNGFLSTEREAADWERRNEAKKEAYVQKFLKDSGLNLNKSMEKKIPRNSPCPCGSKKKYKTCCLNKKVLTGVEGDVKAQIFNPHK